MIFDSATSDGGAFFERNFNRINGGKIVLEGVTRDPTVIDVTDGQVFSRNLISALTEMPGDNPTAKILEHFLRLEAAAIEPVHIIAKANVIWLGGSEILAELVRIILHFGS